MFARSIKKAKTFINESVEFGLVAVILLSQILYSTAIFVGADSVGATSEIGTGSEICNVETEEPCVDTDKDDYSPTDVVNIFGYGFGNTTDYVISLTSETGNFEVNLPAQADALGAIAVSYQLDGVYRPYYSLTVTDTEGTIIATDNFTDSRVINWATVDNGSSTTVAPGASVDVDVNVTTSWDGFGASNDWESTSYLIEGQSTQCSNHSDNTSSGTHTEDFNINAPNSTGTYDLTLIAYWNDNCTGGPSTPLVLTDAITVENTITITNATLNGGSSVTVNPGETISAQVFVTTTGGGSTNDWECTAWRYGSGSWNDVNHGNHTTSGSYDETFNINAPITLGAHTVEFVAYSNNDCDFNPSNTYEMVSAVTVQIVENPALAQSCGIDIALVVDNSGSISSTELATMKAAYIAFLNAFLPATSTQFSVTDFDTTADVIQVFTIDLATLTGAVNGISTTGGFTNWEDALTKANSTFDPRPAKPNLLVMASDGNPNTVDNGPGGNASENQAVYEASLVADTIKTENTRILALGIGNNLDVENLKAISGPTVNAGVTSDVITSDFNTLAADLAALAETLCGGTISVKKLIDADGNTNTTNDQTPVENWPFNVNGTPSDPAPALTGADGLTDPIEVAAGTYSIHEDTSSNALLSAECTGATSNGTQSADGISGLEVSDQDIVTCTIINGPEDAKLTVIKNVTNNDGGDATADEFTIHVSGDNVSNSSFPGSENGTMVTLDPGAYDVTEVLDDRYDVDYSSDCSGTIEAGQHLICTVTNDDKPGQIKVTKKVINDDGGQATADGFNLYINNNPVTSDQYNPLPAGDYNISEDVAIGYTATSLICTDDDTQQQVNSGPVKLANGQSVSCVLTNNDQPGSITVTKHVTNNNGGLAGTDDFLLFVNNALVQSGATNEFAAGQYEITEQALAAGYSQVSIVCKNASGDNVGNPFNLGLGQHISCVVSNDDVPATIKVIKKIINDDGGDAKVSDFDLLVNNNEVTHAATNPVPGNAWYNITEQMNIDGYEQTNLVCTDTTNNQNLGNPFIAFNGHNIVCTITNDDIAPTLTLNKEVINDNGGEAEPEDFHFHLRVSHNYHPRLDHGEEYEAEADKWYRFYEHGPSGYDFVEITGDDYCPTYLNQWFKLPLGQDIECTIVNDDKSPQVWVAKHTDPHFHDQDFDFTLENDDDETDFTLDTAWWDGEYEYVEHFDDLQAGHISVTEHEVDGWNLTDIRCYDTRGYTSVKLIELKIHFGLLSEIKMDGEDRTASFYADIGDTIFCIFDNEGVGDIDVYKFHDLNENGYHDEGEPFLEDWDIELRWKHHNHSHNYDWETTDENGLASFEEVPVAKTYKIDEEVKEGWHQTNIYCKVHRYEIPRDDFPTVTDLNLLDQLPNGDNGHSYSYEDYPWIELEPGETRECYVGNAQDPYLEITKVNDTGGEDRRVGDVVTFTIEVTNPEDSGVVEDATVTDNLQDGFTYNGDATATSNVRGDITGLVGDPGYASPGTWYIGDLLPGEVVTLVYSSTIGNVVDGLYPDTAFVAANDNTLFGNCGVANVLCLSDIDPATPFVGTTVVVVSDAEGEFVLGATLVNTGVAAVLPSMVGSILAILAIGIGRDGKKRSKKTLWNKLTALMIGVFSLTVISLAFATGSSAAPQENGHYGFWTCNSSAPEMFIDTPSVNIDWQVDSTNHGDMFDVRLEETTTVHSDSAVGVDANASGTFSFAFPAEGTYSFTVDAFRVESEDMKNCGTFDVTYDATQPGPVEYEGVVRDGDTYTLSFTAPADGDVKTILIFASTDNESFPLDSTTQIGAVATTPGEEHEFVYDAPTSDQLYFAVLAVDASGNVSDASGDENIETIPPTDTSGLTDEDGDVLGDEDEDSTETDGETDSETDESSDTGTVITIILVLLGLFVLAWLWSQRGGGGGSSEGSSNGYDSEAPF